MEFTEQEKSIMLELISKTQISPLQANAVEAIGILQSLAKKISQVQPT